MARTQIKTHGPGNAELIIDGHSVQELCDFSVHFPVDGVAVVKAQMFVGENFTFEGDTSIEPCFAMCGDVTLVREDLGNGRTRYVATKMVTDIRQALRERELIVAFLRQKFAACTHGASHAWLEAITETERGNY